LKWDEEGKRESVCEGDSRSRVGGKVEGGLEWKKGQVMGMDMAGKAEQAEGRSRVRGGSWWGKGGSRCWILLVGSMLLTSLKLKYSEAAGWRRGQPSCCRGPEVPKPRQQD
jgi:hypothetical protein